MSLGMRLAQPTQGLGGYGSEKKSAETGDSTGGGCHYTLSASDLMGSAHSPLVAGTGRDSASGPRPSGGANRRECCGSRHDPLPRNIGRDRWVGQMERVPSTRPLLNPDLSSSFPPPLWGARNKPTLREDRRSENDATNQLRHF